MADMTIGKLARNAGVSIDTVRFYERRGLIDEPLRTHSNYRIYPKEDVNRLRFIKRAKDLGFSLSEIKELLALRSSPSASKADVKKKVKVKIEDIKKKIKDLSNILIVLKNLDAECDGHGPISYCPIIKALDYSNKQ
jgi:Hg(II)-responsive transcriptional regulator